jgi:hypothetical protein
LHENRCSFLEFVAADFQIAVHFWSLLLCLLCIFDV